MNTGTGGSDPRPTKSEKESWRVAEREKQCIDEALTRSRHELAVDVATPDASADLRIRENQERDRELSGCRARADKENAKISEHDRNEYELQAQQAHDQAALMMILTTSAALSFMRRSAMYF